MVAVFGVVCASGGAFAAGCNPGQYYVCGEDPYDNSCTECECVSCPAGQTSDGSGELYYCPNIYPTSPYGDSGCYEQPCAGYDDQCPAFLSPALKCKKFDVECPNGCNVYSVCNPANGTSYTLSDGACHIEGNGCYENEVNCSAFVIDEAFGAWTCAKENQSGQATWDYTNEAWDTSACTCSVTNKNIDMDVANTVVKCENANASYVVGTADVYKTKKLTDSVLYTLERQYCLKCYSGYLPFVESSPYEGIYISPTGVNSSYGVRVCKNLVSAPYYAPGCTIPYPLNSSSMPDVCRVSCPDRMETIVNGATDDSYCLPKGAPVYEDNSGSFRLGTESCN